MDYSEDWEKVNEVKPAKMIAAIVLFWQSATVEDFALLVYNTLGADINDYHRGKYQKFQKNLGEYLSYLDFDFRRGFAQAVLRFAEQYKKEHGTIIQY